MSSIDLEKEFEWCRENFFPRWHGGAEWQVIDAHGWKWQVWPRFWKTAFAGYCWTEARRIFLNQEMFRLGDKDRIRAPLIHEVCHVFAGNHGPRFQARLRRAIRRAEQMVCSRLARILEQDLKECKSILLDRELPLDWAVVCGIARYGADYPYLTFKEVIRDLFEDCFPPNYIRRRYPGAVYWFRHERRRRKRLHKKWYPPQPASPAAASGRACR